MANAALSTLRARVRRLLNEQVAANSFWTDADLNAFIQTAYEHYYRWYCQLNQTHGRRKVDITYQSTRNRIDFYGRSGTVAVGNTITGGTSGATAVIAAIYEDGTAGTYYISGGNGLTFTAAGETLTATAGGTATNSGSQYTADWTDFYTSGYSIDMILKVEDRTTYDPGDLLEPAESLIDIMESQSVRTDSTSYEATYSLPIRYFFEKAESIASGVVTVRNRIYLGPLPSGNRSLRLHILCGPQAISTGDTYTTGLPEHAETCIVLDAAIQARLMEESPSGASLGSLNARKAEAETNLLRHVSLSREPNRVQYFDVIN